MSRNPDHFIKYNTILGKEASIGTPSQSISTVDWLGAAGFLPLTVSKDLDQQGVERLSDRVPPTKGDRGGKPIYIDLFSQEAKRVLITSTSGSGKSVLGWRFALEALGQNIPIVGSDV